MLIERTFLKEAVKEATNSGKEVLIIKATIPVIHGLIPKIFPKFTPPLTIKSAPLITPERAN